MLTSWFLLPTRTVIVSPTFKLEDDCVEGVDLVDVDVVDVVEEFGLPALLTLLAVVVVCVVLVGCCVGAEGVVGWAVLSVVDIAGVDPVMGAEVLGVADVLCMLALWFTGVKRSVLIVRPCEAASSSPFSTDNII